MKKMHIGLIIAVALIIYWYMKDHPQAAQQPVRQGAITFLSVEAA